jgi:hypothetical protein
MGLSRDPAALSMAELRSLRVRAKRELELARMRSGPDDEKGQARIVDLRLDVNSLTDELIRRYAGDLTLVDSLLNGAYAQDDTPMLASSDPQVGE